MPKKWASEKICEIFPYVSLASFAHFIAFFAMSEPVVAEKELPLPPGKTAPGPVAGQLDPPL